MLDVFERAPGLKVIARATFRQRPPTRGIRAPQRLGLDVSTIAAHPRAACALERFLKVGLLLTDSSFLKYGTNSTNARSS